MRVLWVLGCIAWVSTARAQPAPGEPADAAPAAAPAVPRIAPAVAPAAMQSPMLAPPGMAPVTPAVVTEPEVEGYRWKIAFADAASIALILSHQREATTVGVLSYLLAGPAIHGAHDEGGRTAASLALRIGLPLLTAVGFMTLTSHDCGPEGDCPTGTLIAAAEGLGLGAISAMVIDTALLARPHVAHRETRLTWAPRVSVTPERTSVGILGRF